MNTDVIPIQRRRAALAIAGCVAGWSASAAPATGTSTSFWRQFRGMKLQDHEGRPLNTARWNGQQVLVNFVFTACSTACPIQTRALAEMARQLPVKLRPRYAQLSVSLDPLQDTPQALKAFALRMGVDLARWTFATGRPQDVERLAEALSLFRKDANVRKPDDHSTALWLVDGQGQLRMRYSGNPPDVQRLLREIQSLDEWTQRSRG
jgi:protein SCO1